MIKDGATRDGYGIALVELGHSDSNVVVLDSGVSDSTRTIKFGQEFPERFLIWALVRVIWCAPLLDLHGPEKLLLPLAFLVFLLVGQWIKF